MKTLLSYFKLPTIGKSFNRPAMKLMLATIVSIALIVMLCLMRVEAFVKTMGELAPDGKINMVQHFDGGTIQKILVSNGQTVKKGELIIQLHSERHLAELKQLISKKQQIQTTLGYLSKFTKSQLVNDDVDGQLDHKLVGQLTRENKKLYLAAVEKFNAEMAESRSLIKQRESEIVKVKENLPHIKDALDLLESELNMYEKLLKSGNVSKARWLATKRSVLETKAKLLSMNNELTRLYELKSQAREKLQAKQSDFNKIALEKINKLTGELLEINYQIKFLNDKLKATNITAPVDGTIENLEATIGSIVKPGDVIFTVVPSDRKLEVIAKLNAAEIGHIHQGQDVRLKVNTYDFLKHGFLKGQIKTISTKTNKTEKGDAYYDVQISIDKQLLGNQKLPLRAGMSVEVDILSGKRSLISYLLKPLQMLHHEAFYER